MIYRLLSLLMILFLSSCLGPDDPAELRAVRAEKATGDILIGAVAPWASLDVMLWEGIEMAVEEINAAGGILDRRIRIIKRDDKDIVRKGVIIAQEYAENPDMVAIIGHYESFVTMSASVVYQYYGILLLSTAATAPELTREGFSLIFRMVPDDTIYGKKLAKFCLKHRYKRILVFQQITPAGRDLANAFVIAALEMGIEILYRQEYDFFTTENDFQRLLLRANERYRFDAILLTGQLAQSGTFIDIAREMGIEKPIIGGLDLERAELLKMVGPKVSNIFLPTTFNPDSAEKRVRRFVEAFKRRYGKVPDTQAAQAYDTVHTLAYAIKQAGCTAPPKMAEALYSVKGLEGMTGPISFDAQGNRLGTNIVIKVVKDGRFEYLPYEDE